MSYTNTLNIAEQLDAVVNIVKQTVGNKLSQVQSTTSGQTVPSVIKKRTTDKSSTNQPAVNLPYPYSVVDFIRADLWGGCEQLNFKQLPNGNHIYETDYIVKVSVDFVGRSTDDPHTIACSMHRALTTSYYRDILAGLCKGQLFKLGNDIKRGAILRQTEWVDMSTVILDIAFRDVLEIDSEGNIVRIVIDGELHDQFIDPTPITFTTDTGA
jgi:hypothetical protein